MNEEWKDLIALLEKNPFPLCLRKDMIRYRRTHVAILLSKKWKHRKIANKFGCSLSTIEKDVNHLRNSQGFSQ